MITDQIVLDGNDIDKLGPTFFKSLDTFEPGDENNAQKAKIFITITSGPGAGQQRVVVARNGNTFILAEDWDLDDLPTDESRYIFKRQLGKVNEAEQVDVAMVYNNESLADNVGTLTATHLYGLGMGPDLEIGGLDWKGGMTYTNLENLTINLGAGNDQLEITGIQSREDFQTVTVVNTGDGDDEVHFNGLQAEESGLFALHLEQGDDIVTAENTTAPLIIFGDDGVDTIQSGDGDDIIFADFGRVDYLDTSGELITRFGMGQRGEVKDAVIPAADLESVPFAQTDGNYYGPSLVVSRLDDSGGDDSLNGGGGRDILIGGFGTDTIAGGAEADIIFGDNGRIDFATSGHIAQIRSSLNFGAFDVLNGGDGNNLIFGGFGADGIISGKDDDIIFGDNGVANYTDGDIENLETIDTDASTGGADNINAGDGDNVVFGGVADDQVVSGAGDDVQLGDNGRVDFVAGRLVQVASGDPMFGGKDRLAGGGGNDLLIGGFSNDEMHGDAGDDILIGDNGIADFLNGQLSKIASGDPNLGGEDEIYGGAGNDLLIGGAVADQLYGDSGNDYMVGDAGRATYLSGRLRTVETMDEHRFIGGNDWLDGGAGFDAMFGGHGDDTFVGDFTEDLMIGEYARLTMEGDRAESVVRLGQGNLDLIANRQFGLYNPLALTPSLSQLGSVLLPTQIREFIAAQRPELATDQRPTHHGATSSSAKDQGLGYHPPEDEVEEQAEEEDVDQPSPDVEKLPEEERVEEVESEQPILEDENEEDQDQAPEEMEQPEVPEEKQTDSADSLKAVVAGFVGWGVSSSQRKKTGTAKLLDLDTPKEKARFWRWQDGRLSKSGWAGNDATKTVQYLNVESPIIKTELKRKENV
ncbi:MAG: hypothetical protein GQ578_10000 [Desulfuromonadaceae bacterium]|nr:hypothetical protein [Desulfuromonadaceae bacterium]